MKSLGSLAPTGTLTKSEVNPPLAPPRMGSSSERDNIEEIHPFYYVLMKVLFKVWRQKPKKSPQLESYQLEVQAGNTILECLNRIKWEQDGSLAFRKNCRNTICGSCGMRINGRSALACKQNVGQELEMISASSNGDIPTITVAPLGNMPVIKDLVVDMSGFWDKLQEVDPYVSTKGR